MKPPERTLQPGRWEASRKKRRATHLPTGVKGAKAMKEAN